MSGAENLVDFILVEGDSGRRVVIEHRSIGPLDPRSLETLRPEEQHRFGRNLTARDQSLVANLGLLLHSPELLSRGDLNAWIAHGKGKVIATHALSSYVRCALYLP